MINCALHQVLCLPINYLLSLDYFIFTTNSLWKETREPGENPQLSAERWLTLFTWVRSENQTCAHDLRGERRTGSDDFEIYHIADFEIYRTILPKDPLYIMVMFKLKLT
jgi:hypothetical protein